MLTPEPDTLKQSIEVTSDKQQWVDNYCLSLVTLEAVMPNNIQDG